MEKRATRSFTRLEAVAFLIAMIGVQLSSELFTQWGTFFYSPSQGSGRIVYVGIGVVALMFVAGRVFDIVSDPVIGLWSDRSGQRPSWRRLLPIAGRRRPFIFWGSVLMTGTGILFWHPPVAATSWTNLWFGTLVMSLHWILYTLAYIPLLALAPEVARSRQDRVELGTWIAVGMTLGLAAAILLPGVLIDLLDPSRGNEMEGVRQYSPVGYQRVALIFSVASLGCFQFLVWTVRERPLQELSTSSVPARREIVRAVGDRLFGLYLVTFFLFYIGLLAVQRALPYWAELGLEGDETTVSILGVPYLATCLTAAIVCPWLTKRFDLKWLLIVSLATVTVGMPLMYVIAVLKVTAATKIALGAVLFGLKGIGLGMIYVLATPLLGEIIDFNELRYGTRREGVFNSLHAIMVKSAQILSIGLSTAVMYSFGNSLQSPWGVYLIGPVSAIFCGAGLIAAFFYPTQTERAGKPANASTPSGDSAAQSATRAIEQDEREPTL